MHNICGSKPKIPKGIPNPSVPLTADFFANPRCPPDALAAASSLDPVVVGGEDRSVNSPCHTPIPGPTRMADPNRVRSERPDTGTLYLFFFPQS